MVALMIALVTECVTTAHAIAMRGMVILIALSKCAQMVAPLTASASMELAIVILVSPVLIAVNVPAPRIALVTVDAVKATAPVWKVLLGQTAPFADVL